MSEKDPSWSSSGRRTRPDVSTPVGCFGRATQRLCAKSDGSQVQGHRRLHPLSPTTPPFCDSRRGRRRLHRPRHPLTYHRRDIHTLARLNASNVSSRGRRARLRIAQDRAIFPGDSQVRLGARGSVTGGFRSIDRPAAAREKFNSSVRKCHSTYEGPSIWNTDSAKPPCANFMSDKKETGKFFTNTNQKLSLEIRTHLHFFIY